MALAILKPLPGNARTVRFEANTGENSFYTVWIGEKNTENVQGFKLLDSPKIKGKLKGPLSSESLGKVFIELPKELFDRKNRYVQLVTYKTSDGKGKAYSDVVPVIDYQLPHASFSFNEKPTDTMKPDIPQTQQKAFHYKQEIQLAQAMNLWDLIGKAAQTVLPVIGKVVSNESKKGEEKKPIGEIMGDILQDKETMGSFLDFLKEIGTMKKKKKSSVSTPSDEDKEELEEEEAVAEAKSLSIPHLSNSADKGQAQAMMWQAIIPAIADAAKSPELWNGLNKFHEASLGAILELFGGTLPDHSNFGNDTTSIVQQILNQGAMEKMAELQLEAKAKAKSGAMTNKELLNTGLDFIRVNSVTLDLPQATHSSKLNFASLIFDKGRDIEIPIELSTPKPMQRALLKVIVKPIGDKPAVLQYKEKLYNINNGIISRVVFTKPELKRLIHGEEYQLSARLLWPNKKGVRLGTSITRFVVLSGTLTYKKVIGSTGEVIPLNDVNKYRDFWHKMYGETFTKRRRSLMLDTKYYHTLDVEDKHNNRLETVSKIEQLRTSKFSGKMKSGMEYSLEVLNALLPMISNYPALDYSELEALKASNFANYFSRVARQKLVFDGSPGNSIALWTYPEVELFKVELVTPQSVNAETGVVQEQASKIVHFPIPTKIHFIGTKLA